MNNWGITADIHLRLYSDEEYTETGLPLKLEEILNVFKNMCIDMRTRKIRKVAILGDVNDTKQFASVDAFSEFKKVLEQFPDIEFYIIPGNHDMTMINKEDTEEDKLRTAIDLLKGPKNIITIDKPTIIDNMTFVPYTYIDKIDQLETTDILLSHLGLSDAVLSNGRSIRNRFSSGNFNRWKLTLLGHYHRPQKINNIYYIGSLIPLRRSEFAEDKRYICLDSETLEIESVNTEGYRKYYEFVIDESENVEDKIDMANKLREDGNFVVIRNRTDKVINNPEGIKVIDEFEKTYQTRGLSGNMSDKELMNKYLEIERVQNTDIEEFLKIGLEIINN